MEDTADDGGFFACVLLAFLSYLRPYPTGITTVIIDPALTDDTT